METSLVHVVRLTEIEPVSGLVSTALKEVEVRGTSEDILLKELEKISLVLAILRLLY
jgi:hypothetical protein